MAKAEASAARTPPTPPPPKPRADRLRAILYYHDTVGMYGTKRYSLDLLEALRAQGVEVRARKLWTREVHVAGRAVGGLVTRELSALVPVVGGGVLHATYHNFLPRWRRPDVVTVHDLIPILRPELASGGVKRKALDMHNLRRALRADPEFITVSEATRRDLLATLDTNPARVHAVHHGVHHERFFPEPWPTGRPSPFVPGRLNVLVAMNVDLRKRLDIVLEAARDLPFVHVVQVGRRHGPPAVMAQLSGLRDLEQRLEAEGRYVALAHVNDATLRQLFASADVVAHPSVAEGFSLPPLEALACGPPVAVSDIPVHREVLGTAARFVPNDVEAWRTLFADAWDGQAVRASAFPGREARLTHARTFTWARAARQTAEVYRAVRSRA